MDYEETLVLLEAGGTSFVVHRHAPLRSVAEASAAGLPIEEAAKTLAVMAGGDLVLVVIPAVTSLDLVALGAVLGAADVRLCSRAELAQLGGEPGALCLPVPYRRSCGGGRPRGGPKPPGALWERPEGPLPRALRVGPGAPERRPRAAHRNPSTAPASR